MELKTYTPEEQRENRKKWVEALRSGKYRQAKEQLKTEDGGFCCLGVACDISGLGRWNRNSYLKEEACLPKSVLNWLGLKSLTGLFISGNTESSLARLNDFLGYDFPAIADVIESEPDGLIAKESRL